MRAALRVKRRRRAAPGASPNRRRTSRASIQPRNRREITERLIILKEELQTEQMAMHDAISNNAASATVQRHAAVIAALQSEIGTVK